MGEGGNSQDKFLDPKIYIFLESLRLKDYKEKRKILSLRVCGSLGGFKNQNFVFLRVFFNDKMGYSQQKFVDIKIYIFWESLGPKVINK